MMGKKMAKPLEHPWLYNQYDKYLYYFYAIYVVGIVLYYKADCCTKSFSIEFNYTKNILQYISSGFLSSMNSNITFFELKKKKMIKTF